MADWDDTQNIGGAALANDAGWQRVISDLRAQLASRPAQPAGEAVAWRYRSISPHTGKPTPWLLTQVQYEDEGGLEVEELGVIPSPQPADMEKAVEAAHKAVSRYHRIPLASIEVALAAAAPFLRGAAEPVE